MTLYLDTGCSGEKHIYCISLIKTCFVEMLSANILIVILACVYHAFQLMSDTSITQDCTKCFMTLKAKKLGNELIGKLHNE